MAVLVIENQTIISLLQNSQLVDAFPFLQQAKKALAANNATTCNCSVDKNSLDFNYIKSAIASLPQDMKLKFKQITGASSVSVIYREGATIQSILF